jgi:hypothetical protein
MRMRVIRRFAPLGLGGLAMAVGLGLLGVVGGATAADHLDAPGMTSPGGSGQLDINDVYAFASPGNPGSTTLVMTTNPAAGVLSPTSYSRTANYQFVVDNNRDARPEGFFKINFTSNPNASGRQNYQVVWAPVGAPAKVIGRGTTGDVVPLDGGGRVWAGLRDDPFFFDLNAFLGSGGRSFCDDGTTDFFAGLNTNAIVLEVPTGDTVEDQFAVWGRTRLNGRQIDRMGFPAVNTVFIPKARKTQFNQSSPQNDQRLFSQFVGDLSSVLLPDQLPLDTTNAAGFPNGRQLANDVIDVELQLITGDSSATDCIDANDRPFSTSFPYLASPNPTGS